MSFVERWPFHVRCYFAEDICLAARGLDKSNKHDFTKNRPFICVNQADMG